MVPLDVFNSFFPEFYRLHRRLSSHHKMLCMVKEGIEGAAMYFHHGENFPEKLQITKFTVSLYSGYFQMIIEDEADLFADTYYIFSQN